MIRSLGHLLHQAPFDQFEPILLLERARGDHRLILLDAEPVGHPARRRAPANRGATVRAAFPRRAWRRGDRGHVARAPRIGVDGRAPVRSPGPDGATVQGPNRAAAISQFNRATAAPVGARSKQPGVSSAAGRPWAVPRSPQGVGGEDGIGDHVGGDLKWFIMNGFARRRGAGGNLGERVLGKIR